MNIFDSGPKLHIPHSSIDLRRPMATRVGWFGRMFRKVFGHKRRASRAKIMFDRVRRGG